MPDSIGVAEPVATNGLPSALLTDWARGLESSMEVGMVENDRPSMRSSSDRRGDADASTRARPPAGGRGVPGAIPAGAIRAAG